MFTSPGVSPQFVVTRSVDASALRLFEVLSTEAGMQAWVPLCREARWVQRPGSDTPGVGSVRRFKLAGGITAAERIVLWKAGRQINYRFDQISLPIDRLTQNYEGAMCVEPAGRKGSRLIWGVSFTMSGARRPLEPIVRAGLRALIGHMATAVAALAERREAG